jgi:hypothetical protein
VESNSHQRVKLQLAVIAASAVVVMGAVAAAVLGQEGTSPVAVGPMNVGQTTTSTTAPVGRMNVGHTTTSTTAPAAMATSFAAPTMTAARPNGFG